MMSLFSVGSGVWAIAVAPGVSNARRQTFRNTRRNRIVIPSNLFAGLSSPTSAPHHRCSASSYLGSVIVPRQTDWHSPGAYHPTSPPTGDAHPLLCSWYRPWDNLGGGRGLRLERLQE